MYPTVSSAMMIHKKLFVTLCVSVVVCFCPLSGCLCVCRHMRSTCGTWSVRWSGTTSWPPRTTQWSTCWKAWSPEDDTASLSACATWARRPASLSVQVHSQHWDGRRFFELHFFQCGTFSYCLLPLLLTLCLSIFTFSHCTYAVYNDHAGRSRQEQLLANNRGSFYQL